MCWRIQAPDGWSILAAGNRAEDRSVTFRMPAALINRFVHLDYEVDLKTGGTGPWLTKCTFGCWFFKYSKGAAI